MSKKEKRFEVVFKDGSQLLDEGIYADYAERAPKRYGQVHARQAEDLEHAVDFILKV